MFSSETFRLPRSMPLMYVRSKPQSVGKRLLRKAFRSPQVAKAFTKLQKHWPCCGHCGYHNALLDYPSTDYKSQSAEFDWHYHAAARGRFPYRGSPLQWASPAPLRLLAAAMANKFPKRAKKTPMATRSVPLTALSEMVPGQEADFSCC